MDAGQETFGAFSLDPRRRTLCRDDVMVELGPRATDILFALVAAKGAIVSKDFLITAAWPGQVVEENTLQAQISGLRKALGEAGQDYIITVPGRGYRLVCNEAVPEPAASPVPRSRPSIAVLAFNNLSGDSADECFADGMAEDLITELSRSRSLLVVARNSSFTFKGRSVDVRQLARELGVRYVVEGSIRRAGSRIRVTTQLIEAEGGMHVWAERYDRQLTDLFETQDEITLAVSRAIEPAVESAERSRLLRKRPGNLDAWEALQRAKASFNGEEWAEAHAWFRRSIELDPDFAAPHAERGFFLYAEVMAGRVQYDEALAEAEAESWEAIRLDPNDPTGHAALSMCQVGARDWTTAVHRAARAVELGPSAWLCHCAMALARASTGELDEMANHVDMLRQIGPRSTGRRVTMLMDTRLQFLRGDYERSAAVAKALLAEHPKHSNTHFMLIAALAHLGRLDEAAAWLASWRRAVPGQVALFARMRSIPWWPTETSDLVIDGLRKAGWDG
jgi:TolB-like protein/Flp pilus assembly protein TadD